MTGSRSLHARLAAACLLACGSSHAAEPEAQPLAIVNARIFDGSRVIPRGTVVVEGGRRHRVPFQIDDVTFGR
jgi:hypothetical protein